ncbi:hypothetical protein [Lelliottia sp. CFBP8978]|uniref:hypothetical protein n=1 Tax=Lelliottia sp. CFBP8978 TaxID=3096522 RepID=UPI0039C8DF70
MAGGTGGYTQLTFTQSGKKSHTRDVEYVRDGMNKVIFLILAASLAVIGRYAEKIWQAGSGNEYNVKKQ